MLPEFKKHTPIWFEKRIGQVVAREASIKTPSRIYSVLATRLIKIGTPQHAKACYTWHLENKVNFKEVT